MWAKTIVTINFEHPVNTAAAVFTEGMPDSVMTSLNFITKQRFFEAFKKKKKKHA